MARRYTPKEARKPVSRRKAFLPVLGLALAIALAVVAYVIAPFVVELIEGLSADIARQFAQLRVEYGENAVDYLFMFVLWLVMLALMVFIVAATVGEDPEKEAFKHMGPSPANRDAQIKALRRELKDAKRRAKR